MAETKAKSAPEMEQAPIGQNPETEMTDYQKLQMTQISYIDFDMEKTEQLKGMKLSDAGQYMSNPDLWVQGVQFNENSDGIMNRIANGVVKGMVGEEHFWTDQDLYQRCMDSGFGDLTIKDIVSDKETGFQAMALEDSQGNVYFSFRGSDGDFTKGMGHDWGEANLGEFFVGADGAQVQQAVEFFDRNKSETGQNNLYGHSLGGNLTSHVFLQRENEISEAFCYNANPVSQRLIDTPEKQQAMQSERFTFAITEGDVVSGFKGTESYENRTVYVANQVQDGNILHSHLTTTASFNQDGSFAHSDRDAHMEYVGNEGVAGKVLAVTQRLDQILADHPEMADCIAQICQGQWPDNLKETIQEIGPEAKQWIEGVYEEFMQNRGGLDSITPAELFERNHETQLSTQQIQQPELLLDGFGQTTQAQDTMYIQPEQLMAMSGSIMGMDQTMQSMDGMSMFQTISQTVGQMEGMEQTSHDGLMSWGENTEFDQDMEVEEEMDQEDSVGFKFNGMEL